MRISSKVHIQVYFFFSLLSFSLVGSFEPVYANNITVSNIVIRGGTVSTTSTANFCLVQFNLSWENSWRIDTGASNWDAAWVFVKFRVGSSNPILTGASSVGDRVTVSSTTNLRVGMPVRVTSGTGSFPSNTVISSISSLTEFRTSSNASTALSNATIECARIWEHAYLNNTGHTAPSGSTIDAGLLNPSSAFDLSSNPALGIFIYRNSIGSGSNTFNNMRLRWNYGAGSSTDSRAVNEDALVSVQVFAIEMVYVPQGSFFAGSGGSGVSEIYQSNSPSTPYLVSSENAINVGTASGNLYYSSSTDGGDLLGPIPAAYPKGFNAFYCMKYEISQGQYRDFLNTLTRVQQNTRTGTNLSVGTITTVTNRFVMSNTSALSFRNGIRCDAVVDANNPITFYCDLNANGISNEAADGEWLACNFMNWTDGVAYADWAGLRPMTELEFEKACRGNQPAVSGEYAWGNNSTSRASSITNSGRTDEVASPAGANATYNNSGVLGPIRVGAFARSTTLRNSAGATYYGIMDMSSNLIERAVSIGHPTGRSYTGIHGNGSLHQDGRANVSNWPGLGTGDQPGAGFRGGDWNFTSAIMPVSDRFGASFFPTSGTTRSNRSGFRCVRSFQ
jgi:formylglycine-generating enzyme required for sulfatase activity